MFRRQCHPLLCKSALSLDTTEFGGEIQQDLSPYMRLKALNVAQWANIFPETHVLNFALCSYFVLIT